MNTIRLTCLCVLAVIAPLMSMAAKASIRDQINQAVGREVFIDEADLPDKIYEWKDLQKWFPARGKDPLRMAYPKELEGSGISELVFVRIIITPEGKAINPLIEDLKNKELALPAIFHVAKLKFQVPKKDGKPVYYRQKVKLKCSEDPEFGN